jgi:type IV pilus assembly protein PilC
VQFDELYRNLVKAGESAGVLDTILDTVATYKENTEALKGKIKKALFYPAIIIAVALLVSAILLIFVVPQFQNVFKSFGADLPSFTLMIIAASDFMIAYWWAVFGAIFGAGFALVESRRRSVNVARFFDRMRSQGSCCRPNHAQRSHRALSLARSVQLSRLVCHWLRRWTLWRAPREISSIPTR